MNEEITFTVEFCHESGGYVARWDHPLGHGGITTQGDSLTELQDMVAAAVLGYFEPGEMPQRKPGTLRGMLEQAGVSLEEFVEAL